MSQILPKAPNLSPRTAKTSWLHQRFPWLYAFWKFSRAHTIIGTSLSVVGMYAIVLANTPPSAPNAGNLSLFSLGVTLVACLCGNVYIVGLNQLEDVEIDRINKPHLPLASGEFSRQEGQWIVAITGVLAIVLALWQGIYLFGMVAISLMIGTAYSLPPLRLKRFPFWASLCIFSVRGLVVNLGLYLHFSQGSAILPSVWALSAFVLVFTFAIAIFKDMPDAEGDRQYNISTLTLRLGQKAVFDLSRWVLTICYAGMVIAGLAGLPGVNPLFLITTHLLAIGLLWWRSLGVDLKDKRAISRFYQFIWKLFFLEYIVFAIACWL
jgi:homogentisate phytyltransferase/homogentisate geranylgeranyltransferase